MGQFDAPRCKDLDSGRPHQPASQVWRTGNVSLQSLPSIKVKLLNKIRLLSVAHGDLVWLGPVTVSPSRPSALTLLKVFDTRSLHFLISFDGGALMNQAEP